MFLETGLIGLGVMLALLILRVPVAIALIGVSIGGIAAMMGSDVAISMLASSLTIFFPSGH